MFLFFGIISMILRDIELKFWWNVIEKEYKMNIDDFDDYFWLIIVL